MILGVFLMYISSNEGQLTIQVNMRHHFFESIYRIIYFNNSFHIHW